MSTRIEEYMWERQEAGYKAYLNELLLEIRAELPPGFLVSIVPVAQPTTYDRNNIELQHDPCKWSIKLGTATSGNAVRRYALDHIDNCSLVPR